MYTPLNYAFLTTLQVYSMQIKCNSYNVNFKKQKYDNRISFVPHSSVSRVILESYSCSIGAPMVLHWCSIGDLFVFHWRSISIPFVSQSCSI